METYFLMIYVTIEQENAIRNLFTLKGWPFLKTESADLLHKINRLDFQSSSHKASHTKRCKNDGLFYSSEIHTATSDNYGCSDFHSKNSNTLPGPEHASSEAVDTEEIESFDSACRSIITRSLKRKIDEQRDVTSDKSKQNSKTTKSKKKHKPMSYHSVNEDPDNESIVKTNVEETNHDQNRTVQQLGNAVQTCRLKGAVSEDLPQTSCARALHRCSVIDSEVRNVECNEDLKHLISLPASGKKSKRKAPKVKLNISNSKRPGRIVNSTKAPKGEYHCDECDYTFKYASAYDHHKKDGACVFICPYCGKRYTARYYFNYQLHLKYHNNEKQHLCSTCGKAFTERSKLTIHLRTHSNERPFICDTCGRAFYTSMLLRCHIKHMHRERPKSFSCDLCNSKFVSIYNLNTHKNVTHSNVRPYQCQICQKTFKTKYALEKKHMPFHDENGQLFYCTSCPKSFRKKEYLNVHMKRHKNERSHFCDKCGKGFYDTKTLKEHDRTHSGEKPFACTKCEYRCALKGNLSKHMKTHTEDESQDKELTCPNKVTDFSKDYRERETGDPILNQRPNSHVETNPLLMLPVEDTTRPQIDSSGTQIDLLKSPNSLAREQNETEALRSDNDFSNSLPMLPVLMQYNSFSQYQDSQGTPSLDGSAFTRLEPGLSQNDLNYTQYGSLFDTGINPFSFHLK